jgi:hypothetical protein
MRDIRKEIEERLGCRIEDADIVMGCCFCGKEMENTGLDPCGIWIETRKGKWQIFFCHLECFKRKLHKEFACEVVLDERSKEDTKNYEKA